MNETKAKLKDIIETIDDLYLNKDIMEVSDDTLLKDLGIDSLGRINLFYGIIDDFGVDRDENTATNWKTVKDVLLFIEEL